MCNTTSLGTQIASNSICICFKSSWAFSTMKRDRVPQAGNPRAAIKLLWNISAHPSGRWEEVDPTCSWSDWCSSHKCRPLSALRAPQQCSPRSSSECCSLSCCLCLNGLILQQMRPQGEVNPSRNIKRQERLQWTPCPWHSVLAPVSPFYPSF